MLNFLRRNYKKFFIIFSAFILFYSVFIVQVHDVNAFAVTSPDSIYTDLRYINGVKHLSLSVGSSSNRMVIDFPTTSSSYFSIDSLDYTISAYDTSFTFSQSMLYSTHIDITSFQYPNSLGGFAIYVDSLLYKDMNEVDGLGFIINCFLPTSSDSISYSIYFNYYYYNSVTSSISLLSYGNSGSYTGNEFLYAPFQDFIEFVDTDYDYHFLRDIVIVLTPDFSETTSYQIVSSTSDDPMYFSYQNFITLNDFSLGASQEELNDAYDIGFSAGVESVDTQEYYNQGYTNASQDFLKFENLIFGVMNGFTNTISQLFDFQIFGISVFGLIGGLVAIAFGVGIIILIIKVIKIFT